VTTREGVVKDFVGCVNKVMNLDRYDLSELGGKRELQLVLTPFLLFGSAKTEVALFLARAGRIAPPLILLGLNR